MTMLKSAIESKAELIQIGLIIATASMISSQQKGLEITNRNVNPFEITDFVF